MYKEENIVIINKTILYYNTYLFTEQVKTILNIKKNLIYIKNFIIVFTVMYLFNMSS